MTFYLIQHKATEQLMPACARRGYSAWNPATGTVPFSSLDVPRLLKSRKQAQSCINAWALGEQTAHRGFSENFDSGREFDEVITVANTDGRKKDDLRIVRVRMTLVIEKAK